MNLWKISGNPKTDYVVAIILVPTKTTNNA